MAFAHTATTARDFAAPQVATRRTPGLMRRLLDRLMAARMRQAEREIAAYLQAGGGRFTDETEREIERRFLSNPARF
ncbi:MAG: hypothetical protein P8Z80_10080 [Pseudolabrys sp.]|jgi:hypothetical protein